MLYEDLMKSSTDGELRVHTDPLGEIHDMRITEVCDAACAY